MGRLYNRTLPRPHLYDRSAYAEACLKAFGKKPAGGRIVDYVNFYQVSLVSDTLDEQTGARVFDHILAHDAGIHYVYQKPLSVLPEAFSGIDASRHFAALELICAYKRNFVIPHAG